LREPLFVGRFAEALPFTAARPFTLAFPLAEGGRLFASSRCREDVAPLFASRPTRMFDAAAFPRLVLAPFPDPLLTRPADNPRVSMVRTGMWEAAAPGAVRAITERFVTEEGGLRIPPRAFAAPVKLVRVGEKSVRLLTCAPRKAASETCIDPRLILSPFTNAFREAAVTARALWA
jgi:hypothetical protein